MKVFIAGATGRVAEETIKNLVQLGHQVTAGARQPECVIALDKVNPVKLDLQQMSRNWQNWSKITMLFIF